MRRALVVAAALLVGSLAGGVPAASAHPLGNATVNHADALRLGVSEVTVESAVDVAEIPTFQRRPQIDTDGDGKVSPAEAASYAGTRCADLARTAQLTVGGTRVPLEVTRSGYAERPGAIGLVAGRLDCSLRGPADLSRPAAVSFRDDYDGQGLGWHEVTATGDGVVLDQSPFPAVSPSDGLRAYPNGLLAAPLDVRSGTVQVRPGSGSSSYAAARRLPVAGPAVRALDALASTFNRTVGAKHLTVAVGLLGLLLSLALGAGHAMLPGHGKTVMAAYLVGRRGRLRDVVVVGATVTITHTAGVLVLGLLLSTTAAFAPTAAEQWLGVASGLLVAAVGLGLLVSALRRRGRPVLAPLERPAQSDLAGPAPAGVPALVGAVVAEHEHEHEHDHEHDHDHAGHGRTGHEHAPHAHEGHDHAGHEAHDHESHDHAGRAHAGHEAHDDAGHDHPGGLHSHGRGRPHRHGPQEPGFSRGGLVGLGVAGGLVPSPSALLVLLAAVALGRTAFGILLVLGYGLGMAGALCLAGLLLVKARSRLDRMLAGTRLARAERLLAVLPVLTALLVIAVGTGLALRAAGGTV